MLSIINVYPFGFAELNLVSNFASIICVAARWLFLYILYVQLVEGKAAWRYSWLSLEFYTDILQGLLNRAYNSIEWAITSPPLPHSFVDLPTQSSVFYKDICGILNNILDNWDIILINLTISLLNIAPIKCFLLGLNSILVLASLFSFARSFGEKRSWLFYLN